MVIECVSDLSKLAVGARGYYLVFRRGRRWGSSCARDAFPSFGWRAHGQRVADVESRRAFWLATRARGVALRPRTSILYRRRVAFFAGENGHSLSNSSLIAPR
jgi:hypothetical protein